LDAKNMLKKVSESFFGLLFTHYTKSFVLIEVAWLFKNCQIANIWCLAGQAHCDKWSSEWENTAIFKWVFI